MFLYIITLKEGGAQPPPEQRDSSPAGCVGGWSGLGRGGVAGRCFRNAVGQCWGGTSLREGARWFWPMTICRGVISGSCTSVGAPGWKPSRQKTGRRFLQRWGNCVPSRSISGDTLGISTRKNPPTTSGWMRCRSTNLEQVLSPIWWG